MALLLFSDGETFATDAIRYEYRPAIQSETTNRIVLPVAVENTITQAVVDTGAPYPIIAPQVARRAGLNRVEPLERKIMLVRGMRLEGIPRTLFKRRLELQLRYPQMPVADYCHKAGFCNSPLANIPPLKSRRYL